MDTALRDWREWILVEAEKYEEFRHFADVFTSENDSFLQLAQTNDENVILNFHHLLSLTFCRGWCGGEYLDSYASEFPLIFADSLIPEEPNSQSDSRILVEKWQNLAKCFDLDNKAVPEMAKQRTIQIIQRVIRVGMVILPEEVKRYNAWNVKLSILDPGVVYPGTYVYFGDSQRKWAWEVWETKRGIMYKAPKLIEMLQFRFDSAKSLYLRDKKIHDDLDAKEREIEPKHLKSDIADPTHERMMIF